MADDRRRARRLRRRARRAAADRRAEQDRPRARAADVRRSRTTRIVARLPRSRARRARASTSSGARSSRSCPEPAPRRRRRGRARRLPRLPAAAEGARLAPPPHRARLPRRRRRRPGTRSSSGRCARPARSEGATVEIGDEELELVPMIGPLRRRVRPAAQRARRARARRRRTRSGSTRLVVLVAAAPGAQARRRRPPRRGSSSRAPRSPATRSCSTSTRARSTCCATHPEWDDAALPDRRRRVRATSSPGRSPDEVLERARLAVATRPGLPARAARGGARAARAARAGRSSSSSSRCRSPRATLRARLERGEPTRRPRAAGRRGELIARERPLRPRPGLHWQDRLTSLEQARRIAALAQEKLARGRRHPRHAAGLQLHRLLRRLHRAQPASDEGDLGRGARAAQARDGAAAALGRRASARRRGSSPTTSTSSCTSSRPTRATSTASRTSGATSRSESVEAATA